MPPAIRKYTHYALLAVLLFLGVWTSVAPDTNADDADETPGIASVEPVIASRDAAVRLARRAPQVQSSQARPTRAIRQRHHDSAAASKPVSSCRFLAASLLDIPLRS